MSTVELTFSPLPAHVRTARLIATAVARRGGVEESILDEVRLAVGEACSRAVEAHRLNCPEEPVQLELHDVDGRFEVVVTDTVPDDEVGSTPRGLTEVPAQAEAGDGMANLGLAVISGLADDVEVTSTSSGVRIRMSWPTKQP
jgi:serine/threonine-protein kinase RsbW